MGDMWGTRRRKSGRWSSFVKNGRALSFCAAGRWPGVLILVLWSVVNVHGYREMPTFNTSDPRVAEAEPAVFPPYDPGFVGRSYDPSNPQRWRTNEGNPLGTTQPNLFDGVHPRQNCPGMTPPDENGVHWCTHSDAGYCDRRSGTCFCFEGYAGKDCSECNPAFYRGENATCVPRVLCPQDCSGAGVCDHATGTCTCDPHRRGLDCSQSVCPLFDPFCVECDTNQCRACLPGYYLRNATVEEAAGLVNDSSPLVSLGLNPYHVGPGGSNGSWAEGGAQVWPSVCAPCTVFDPRCEVCTEELGCVECADPLLRSVRRSGRRARDVPLPFDEYYRELSRLLPFGTQNPFAFEEAEPFFLITDHPFAAAGAWIEPGKDGVDVLEELDALANSTARRQALAWHVGSSSSSERSSITGTLKSHRGVPLRGDEEADVDAQAAEQESVWQGTDDGVERLRDALRDRWFFQVTSRAIQASHDHTPIKDSLLTPLERSGWLPSEPEWAFSPSDAPPSRSTWHAPQRVAGAAVPDGGAVRSRLPNVGGDVGGGVDDSRDIVEYEFLGGIASGEADGIGAHDVYSVQTDRCAFYPCTGRLSEAGSGEDDGNLDAWERAEDPSLGALFSSQTHSNLTVVPLDRRAVACAQGMDLDARWRCVPTPVSHRLCGHPGTIRWASPSYAVREDDRFLRVAIRRSGGGLGKVSVKYRLVHGTTSDADISPVGNAVGGSSGVAQTEAQTIVMEDGVVQASFLLSLHDDLLLEGNETCALVLLDPTGGAILGPQLATGITIIDDDWHRVSPQCSAITSPSGHTRSSWSIQSPPNASEVAMVETWFDPEARLNPPSPSAYPPSLPPIRAIATETLLVLVHARRPGSVLRAGEDRNATSGGETAYGGFPALDNLGGVAAAPPRPCARPGDAGGLRPIQGAGKWEVGGDEGMGIGEERFLVELRSRSSSSPSYASTSSPLPNKVWTQRIQQASDVSGDGDDGVGEGPLAAGHMFPGRGTWGRGGGGSGMVWNGVSGGSGAEGLSGRIREEDDMWRSGRGRESDGWAASAIIPRATGFDSAQPILIPTDRTQSWRDGNWSTWRGMTAVVAEKPSKRAMRSVGWVRSLEEEGVANFPTLWSDPRVSQRIPPVLSAEAVWSRNWTSEQAVAAAADAEMQRAQAIRGLEDAGMSSLPRLFTPILGPSAPDKAIYAAGIVPAHAGSFDLHTWHAQQGGLLGEYFRRSDLRGRPEIARMDHGVNFTWGLLGGPLGLASSARWWGKVEIPNNWNGASEVEVVPVDFFVSGGKDDHARLWVDGKLLIDAWGPIGIGRGSAMEEARLGEEPADLYTGVTVPRDCTLEHKVGGVEERDGNCGDGPLGWRAYSLSFLRSGNVSYLSPNKSSIVRLERPLVDSSARIFLPTGRLIDIRLEWRSAGHPHGACRLEWALPERIAQALADTSVAKQRYSGRVHRGADLRRRWKQDDPEDGYIRMAIPPESLYTLRPVAGSPVPIEVVPGPASASGATTSPPNTTSTSSPFTSSSFAVSEGDASIARLLAAKSASNHVSSLPGAVGGSVVVGDELYGMEAGKESVVVVDGRDASGNSRLEHGASDLFRIILAPIDAVAAWIDRGGFSSPARQALRSNATAEERFEAIALDMAALPATAAPGATAAGRDATLPLSEAPGLASLDIPSLRAAHSEFNPDTKLHTISITPESAGPHIVWVQLWKDWESFEDFGGSPFAVPVRPAPPQAFRSNFSGPALTDARVNEPASIALTVRDSQGNPIPQTSSRGGDDASADWVLHAFPLWGGEAAWSTLTPSYPLPATLSLTGLNSSSRTVREWERLGRWYRGSGGASDGTDDDFPIAQARALREGSFSATTAGPTRVSVLLGHSHAEGSPFEVFVRPGPAAGPYSELVWKGGLGDGGERWMIATQPNTWALLLRDAEGNPLWHYADAADLAETRAWMELPGGGHVVNASTVLLPDETGGVPGADSHILGQGDAVRFLIVPPVSSAEWVLHVQVRGEEVSGSPLPVVVVPGPALGNTSAIAGAGSQECMAGHECGFLVQPRDAIGNPSEVDVGVEDVAWELMELDPTATPFSPAWQSALPSFASNASIWDEQSQNATDRVVQVARGESAVQVTLTLVEASSGKWYGEESVVEVVNATTIALLSSGIAPWPLLPPAHPPLLEDSARQIVRERAREWSANTTHIPDTVPPLRARAAAAVARDVWFDAGYGEVDDWSIEQWEEGLVDRRWGRVSGNEESVEDAVGLIGVWYKVFVAGVWRIDVSVEGTAVASTPIFIPVLPGPAHGPESVALGDGLDGDGNVAGERHRVRVQLRDAWGNDVLREEDASRYSVARMVRATFGANSSIPTSTAPPFFLPPITPFPEAGVLLSRPVTNTPAAAPFYSQATEAHSRAIDAGTVQTATASHKLEVYDVQTSSYSTGVAALDPAGIRARCAAWQTDPGVSAIPLSPLPLPTSQPEVGNGGSGGIAEAGFLRSRHLTRLTLDGNTTNSTLDTYFSRAFPSSTLLPTHPIHTTTLLSSPTHLSMGLFASDYTPTDASRSVLIPLVLPGAVGARGYGGQVSESGLLRRLFEQPGWSGRVEHVVETQERVANALLAEAAAGVRSDVLTSVSLSSALSIPSSLASRAAFTLALHHAHPLTYTHWGQRGPPPLNTPETPIPQRSGFSVLWEGWIRIPTLSESQVRQEGAVQREASPILRHYWDSKQLAVQLQLESSEGLRSRLRFGKGVVDGVGGFEAFPPSQSSLVVDVNVAENASSGVTDVLLLTRGLWYPIWVDAESFGTSPTRSIALTWKPVGEFESSWEPLPWAWLYQPHAECVAAFESYTAPAPATGPTSTAEGQALEEVMEGEEWNALVEVRDEFGNTRVQGGDEVEVDGVLVEPWSDALDPSFDTIPTPSLRQEVEDVGSGMYEITFQPGAAGKWRVDVTVNKNLPPAAQGVSARDAALDLARTIGAPYLVNVLPGASDAELSFAWGPGLIRGVAGETFEFVVQLVDSDGNNRTSSTTPTSPLSISLSLHAGSSPNEAGPRGPFSLRSLRIPTTLTPATQGRIIVEHDATVAGVYDVNARLGASSLRDAPYTLQIAPNGANPSSSYVVGLPGSGKMAWDVALLEEQPHAPRGAYVPEAMAPEAGAPREVAFAIVAVDAFGNRRVGSTMLQARAPPSLYRGAFPYPLLAPAPTPSSTPPPTTPQESATGAPPGPLPIDAPDEEQVPFGDAFIVRVESVGPVQGLRGGVDVVGIVLPAATGAEAGSLASLLPPNTNASIADAGGVFVGRALIPEAGEVRIHVLLASGDVLRAAGGHGLLASLFHATTPLSPSPSPVHLSNLILAPNATRAIFRGYIRAPFSANYFFHASIPSSCDSIFVGLGREQSPLLTSSASTSSPTTSTCTSPSLITTTQDITNRTILRAGQLYEITVEWQRGSASSGLGQGLSLLWSFQGQSGVSTTQEVIPQSLFYPTAQPIHGSPFLVTT